MGSLEGKVAVVTGASRGIGAAIAKRLAQDGAVVVVNYLGNASMAEDVVASIERAGGKARAMQADISEPDHIVSLFQRVAEAYERLDILVNNAGTAEFLALNNADQTHIDSIFNLNVKGLLLATRAASELMSFGGRIINISSGAARAGNPNGSVYAGSKAAVDAITACLAAELGPRGITVNAVSPGITTTDLLDRVIPRDVQDLLVTRTPLGRLGTPEDIADVVGFLASDDARWVTGQVIGASGGLK